MSVRSTAHTLAPEMAPEELEALTGLLRRHQFTGRHLEIGTAAGGTLCTMMRCYPEGRPPAFTVVDPMGYFPNQLEAVRSNLQRNGLDPDAVRFEVATSDAAFRRAREEKATFDFMLIDGAHKIRYVTQDLRWLDLLDVGGRACFHDYAPRCPGVVMALDRFLARNPGFRREGLAGSLLILERTTAHSGPGIGGWDQARAAMLSPWLQFRHSLSKRIKNRPRASGT